MPPFLMQPSLLRAVAPDTAIGKGRGLLWAVSKTTDASALVSPLKKLELTEMCPREESPADPIGLIILTHG